MWPPSASSTTQTEIFLHNPQIIVTAALDTEPPRPDWPETKGQAQSLASGTGPFPARYGQSRGKFQGQLTGVLSQLLTDWLDDTGPGANIGHPVGR
jgi:hypothetical protein